MASPNGMDLSKFKSKGPKQKFTPKAAETSNIRDYAAMFLRGVSGFAPGGWIGAAAGGIGEGLAQTIEDRDEYNPALMATAAATGAIPFGKAAGFFRGMLKGGALSGGSNVANQLAETGEVDIPQVALATGLGSLGGGLASKLDLSKFIPKKAAPIAAKVAEDIPEVKITPKPTRTISGAERIRTSDPGKGREIMAQIEQQSKIGKSIPKTEPPKVSLQTPKDIVNNLEPGGGSLVISLANLPKAFSSSGDLSFPLRQGIFLLGRKSWWNAWKPMFQSLSEGKYNQINAEIASHPKFAQATEDGLAITTLEGLQKREEAFASDLAAKFPIIKQSERAFITFANKLRLDLYNDLTDKAARLYQGNVTPEIRKNIVNYINTATGRGSMGLTVGGKSNTLEAAAPLLNTVFFSPRLIASRVQLLNPVSYVKMDPFTRRQALRDLATFTSVASTALWLAKASGAQVALDPTDPDFGKIRNGDVRVDILGGFGQYIRFFSQAVKGLTTEEKGPNPWRFIESKLSPSARMVKEIVSGKDYFGRDISVPKSVLNAFSPMITKDIYDLYQEDPNLLPLSGLSMFGLPVQSYGDVGKSGTSTGLPRTNLDLTKFRVKGR